MHIIFGKPRRSERLKRLPLFPGTRISGPFSLEVQSTIESRDPLTVGMGAKMDPPLTFSSRGEVAPSAAWELGCVTDALVIPSQTLKTVVLLIH